MKFYTNNSKLLCTDGTLSPLSLDVDAPHTDALLMYVSSSGCPSSDSFFMRGYPSAFLPFGGFFNLLRVVLLSFGLLFCSSPRRWLYMKPSPSSSMRARRSDSTSFSWRRLTSRQSPTTYFTVRKKTKFDTVAVGVQQN